MGGKRMMSKGKRQAKGQRGGGTIGGDPHALHLFGVIPNVTQDLIVELLLVLSVEHRSLGDRVMVNPRNPRVKDDASVACTFPRDES